MNPVTTVKGEKYKLPACGFTAPANKEFNGWDKGAPGTEINITGDTVIKALWKDLLWNITFDTNGGTGSMAMETVIRGQQYTLPECGFTPPRYKLFDTWDRGDPGTTISITADTIIYAVWKDISGIPVHAPEGKTLTYDGTEQTGVAEGDHYTVTGNTGTNAGDYTATVSLTDSVHYCWEDGTVEDRTVAWKISPKAVTPTVTLSATSYVYDGKAKKPGVTVTVDDTVLDSTWYTAAYASGRINAGTYKVTVTLQGNYTGAASASFKITAKKITPKVTLSATAYTWDGKVKTPAVTVKSGSTTLKKNTDYTVTYPSGRKNVGIYKITVKLKGNYSGSKDVNYTINPKGTTLKTLTAEVKGFTAKWNKQASKMSASVITGYQIQLATDSKFTKNLKTVSAAGYATVTKKITGLKASTKYYVRIRTYKKVGSKTYYSPWSKALTVTTKK